MLWPEGVAFKDKSRRQSHSFNCCSASSSAISSKDKCGTWAVAGERVLYWTTAKGRKNHRGMQGLRHLQKMIALFSKSTEHLDCSFLLALGFHCLDIQLQTMFNLPVSLTQDHINSPDLILFWRFWLVPVKYRTETSCPSPSSHIVSPCNVICAISNLQQLEIAHARYTYAFGKWAET